MILAGGNAAGSGWLAIVVPVLAVLVGGGGLVAYLRLRKESPNIVVQAAQGAVIVQSGVIESLQEEIRSLRGQVRDLERRDTEAAQLHARVRELEHREEELNAQNSSLRSQVADLQARVKELERPVI